MPDDRSRPVMDGNARRRGDPLSAAAKSAELPLADSNDHVRADAHVRPASEPEVGSKAGGVRR
jgi:hypothetical protein